MKRIAAFLFVATLAEFAALPATAMTWSVNPSNANQIIDDTGSWTLTLANFNNTYDGVQFNGKQIDGVAYEEKGANGVIDLTTVEVDTGLKIVSIGAHKFGRSSSGTPNTFLKEVYLPDTIGYWGQGTFRFCTALEKIKVPTSLARVESDRHFEGCTSLTTVYYTGFEPVEGTVALPPCFKGLTEFMFASVPMTRFYGPGVIHVQRSCFPGCTKLRSAEFSPNAVAFMENNGNSASGIFHNDTSFRDNLVNLYPSTFCADFVMAGSNLSIPFNNTSRNFKGTGWIRDTAITNYFDFSACNIPKLDEFVCYNTCIAGATFPKMLTEIGNRAFNSIRNSATFRFLGPPPEFKNNNQGGHSVFYQSQQNQVGYRHTLIVDAETYPAWTNAAKFVAVKDFATNSIVSKAYSTSSVDFPTPKHPEETLGVTTWGFEGNSGNGARFAWLVQYVDHSSVAATWMNGDVQFDSTTVATGTAPTAPDGTPAKASTAEFDYTFIGWNTDPDATTALDLATLALDDDTTFYAIFSAATRSYTITWKLDANTDIDTTTVLYGDVPTHADASKASDETYSYSFDGWSTDGSTVLSSIPAVTGAATYIAVFTQHSVDTTAIVSWFDEDGTTALDPAQTTVEKGVQPTHTEPTKAATVDTVFTFAGWTEVGGGGTVYDTADLPVVTADVSYKAVYSSATRQYTVTFANWDGTVLSATAYDYGTEAASVVAPSAPTRAADAEYTYTFADWDAAIAAVTADATYTATYTATPNEYTATFLDGIDGAVIAGPTTYAFGAAVTAPAAPEHYGYTFASWSPEVGTMPSADTTYTATYTPNKYTITWVNGDSTTTAKYDYHTEVSAITVPAGSKTSTPKASYTFVEWSPAIESVESNTTYTATFTMNILSPMTIALDSAAYDRSQGEATVVTVVGNTDAAATTTAEATAQFRTASVTGEATVDGTTVTSVFDNFASGRGYEWTITATQTYGAEYSGASESASIKGRTYARAAKSWFGDGDVTWAEGAFAPAAQSGSGAQVRLHSTVTFPAILPRALPEAGSAVVGITAYQRNAGVAPRYYAWNGSQWVKLVGVAPKGGVEVRLLGVVDFARKDGPAVAWYADGFQLTTEAGDWEVPLAGGTKLTSFGLVGDLSVGSLSGDHDIGGDGLRLLVR